MPDTHHHPLTETVDFLVIGSGAGGMTAAIRAHDLGLKTLVVEKSRYYGGTSAMSGGSLWIPNNHQMASKGIADSDNEALTYLKALTQGTVAEDRLRAFITKGAEMLRYLEDHHDLQCDALPKYADYYPNQPGAKPGARTLEAKRFLTLRLGRDLLRLRPPHPACVTFGRLHMTAAEAYYSVRGHWQMYLAMLTSASLFVAGLPLRLFAPRSTRVTLGNALVASLRLGLKRRRIPLWLESPATRLLTDANGAVTGAVVSRHGHPVTVMARQGVLLASGGFEHNPALRQQHLPQPSHTAWSAANKHNTGDALLMTAHLKPQLALMDDAWWTPGTVVPDSPYGHALVFEKSMPHGIFVNSRGERFTNEAAPYIDVVKGMYANHAPDSRQSVPCWLIIDSRYRRKTALAGAIYPHTIMPDSAVPRHYWNRLLFRSDTLAGLAHDIGVDAQRLQETITRFNGFADTGIDLDFGRGGNAQDRYYSRHSGGPNPTLGKLDKSPFYAIPVVAGDIGTKGGLLTDAAARVLGENNQPIQGLFACGNCSAAVMGPSYAGAGSTLGPAMAFGFIAAETAAGNT